MAIVHPFSYEVKMTSKVTASCIIITWTASAILASVPAFTLISTKLTNNCTSPYSAALLFYSPVTQYIAITLILSFTYTRILIIAKKQHSKIQIQNLNVIGSIAGGNPQVANQAIRMSVKNKRIQSSEDDRDRGVCLCGVLVSVLIREGVERGWKQLPVCYLHDGYWSVPRIDQQQFELDHIWVDEPRF